MLWFRLDLIQNFLSLNHHLRKNVKVGNDPKILEKAKNCNFDNGNVDLALGDNLMSSRAKDDNEKLVVSGRRIVDMGHFLNSLKNIRHKTCSCTFVDVDTINETRFGFKSIFTLVIALVKRINAVDYRVG